jgi:hypothetical protein
MLNLLPKVKNMSKDENRRLLRILTDKFFNDFNKIDLNALNNKEYDNVIDRLKSSLLVMAELAKESEVKTQYKNLYHFQGLQTQETRAGPL